MVIWERALIGQYPIIAYACIPSQLPEFQRKTHGIAHSKATVQTTYLREPETDSGLAENVTESGKTQAYLLRLPYTETMLQRRYDGGGDVPAWYLWERLGT